MKRIASALCAATLILIAISLISNIQRVSAQGAATPTATLDPAQILQRAQSANDAATAANNSASNAINIVNSMLSFIQVAGILGGALISIAAIVGTLAGFRTLKEYRDELSKARSELDELRSGLNQEAVQVRSQVENSVHALAMMQLGEQPLKAHNFHGAIQMYRLAFELDPNNRATNYFLGVLYIEVRQFEKGIDHLKRALTGGTNYAPAEAALGYALRLQADSIKDSMQHDALYAQAEAHFLHALEIDPGAIDINGESVQAVLGGLYKRQGRYDKAIERYEQGEKVTPSKSYPVGNLAILYYMKGNLDRALDYFRRTENTSTRNLEAHANDYWSRLDRMMAWLALGNLDEAMHDLQIALHQVQNPNPLESILGDLNRLKQSPKPPDGIDQVIGIIQERIEQMRQQHPAA